MSSGDIKRTPFVPTLLASPKVECTLGADGATILTSNIELGEYPVHQGEILQERARRAPDNVLLAERRADDTWRKLTYAEAADLSARVGQALLDRGHGAGRPIAMLCDATMPMSPAMT